MATLDDILTTQKNGVVAVNNLNQTLDGLLSLLVGVYGDRSTGGVNASGLLVSGAGRIVSMSVITAGSSVGTIYNYKTNQTATTAGTGATATITVANPAVTFGAGETVVITNVVPVGYNGTFTTTAGGSNTFQYASAATGAQVSPGSVFRAVPANAIAAIPTSIGVYQIGSRFENGLYILLGTGQVVNINYALD
jgi:hypothetical protein